VRSSPAKAIAGNVDQPFPNSSCHTGTGTQWSFTGEQNDPNGLEYLRARYYDPAQGRFLSRDPVLSQQPYAYVGNNPIRFTDPYGYAPWDRVASCIGDPADCAGDIVEGGRDVGGAAIDVVATAPYGVYYGSYQALDWINNAGPLRFLIPGEATLEGILVYWEGVGRGGDVALDWLRLQLTGEKSDVGIWDEGYAGSMCPDPVEGALKKAGMHCPLTYLPGLHRVGDGKEGKPRKVVDWQW
jgi:RHS repeat-associated protein